MAKRKNMKADKPMFTGRIMFDGNIQVKLLGSGGTKTLRTDLCGWALRKADPNKELLVLTKHFTDYNEIHTGYIVRMKRYDDLKAPCFGLKSHPDDDNWSVVEYRDVVAWGYADGGLNDPTLFYSCQSTVEEEIEREKRRAEQGMKTHAEQLAEMDAEKDDFDNGDFDDDTDRRCVKFKVTDEEIIYNAVMGKDEAKRDGGTELMHDCAKAFCDFRKLRPEVTEMHFYTDQLLDTSKHEE